MLRIQHPNLIRTRRKKERDLWPFGVAYLCAMSARTRECILLQGHSCERRERLTLISSAAVSLSLAVWSITVVHNCAFRCSGKGEKLVCATVHTHTHNWSPSGYFFRAWSNDTWTPTLDASSVPPPSSSSSSSVYGGHEKTMDREQMSYVQYEGTFPIKVQPVNKQTDSSCAPLEKAHLHHRYQKPSKK